MRIEICGGIAAGKTTLATLLKQLDFDAVFESFQQNPFLESYHSNPIEYAFETDLSFLLQHYHDVKKSQKQSPNVLCDFSFYMDLAYAKLSLKEKRLEIFENIYDEVLKELSQPDLIILLDCQCDIQHSRIIQRGRKEEQTISQDFLDFLNSSIKKEISDRKNIFSLNSAEINFYSDGKAKEKVLSDVRNFLY
jgi:deoxyguanosine kinase